MDKVTVKQLVETLYATIRAHVNYDSEFDLPRMQLHYHPTLGWELFMTDWGAVVTPRNLFRKVHESPEKALVENIAYFEQFKRRKCLQTKSFN